MKNALFSHLISSRVKVFSLSSRLIRSIITSIKETRLDWIHHTDHLTHADLSYFKLTGAETVHCQQGWQVTRATETSSGWLTYYTSAARQLLLARRSNISADGPSAVFIALSTFASQTKHPAISAVVDKCKLCAIYVFFHFDCQSHGKYLTAERQKTKLTDRKKFQILLTAWLTSFWKSIRKHNNNFLLVVDAHF